MLSDVTAQDLVQRGLNQHKENVDMTFNLQRKLSDLDFLSLFLIFLLMHRLFENQTTSGVFKKYLSV
jgi:hypothetical protein